jgi:hypothetical protein
MPKKKRPPKEFQVVFSDDLPDAEREKVEKEMAELERQRKAPEENDDIPF